MVIAVDAMGGDFAPVQLVAGAVRCQKGLPVEIALVGRSEQIRSCWPDHEEVLPNLRIIEAAEVIEMAQEPTRGVRGRGNSSLAIAVEMVRNSEADAVVSAGNSGAFMALALTRLGVIAGLRRPGIAAPIITSAGPGVIIDGGANVDCQPIHLAQFGLMGSVYAEYALKIDRPRVGLLSIGSEATKGNSLTRAAYDLLMKLPINFIGNIEGNSVFGGEADVVVADGFTGNVALKVGEGMAQFVIEELRRYNRRSALGRIGAWLLRGSLGDLAELFDYSTYGGALLLGVEGICVVSHGRSDAKAIANAIAVAYQAVEGRVVAHLKQACGAVAEIAT